MMLPWGVPGWQNIVSSTLSGDTPTWWCEWGAVGGVDLEDRESDSPRYNSGSKSTKQGSWIHLELGRENPIKKRQQCL